MPKRRSAKKKTSGDGVVVRTPAPTDVLFGRGGHVNHNPANQRYLELVNQRKEEYQNVAKTDKASIAWEIFHELSSKGARFLKKDYSTNLWHAVEDADVRRKISQCLRERGIPVCPVAKGKAHKKKQQKAEMPKLRASARIGSRTMTTTSSSTTKWSSMSDEDEWLPEEEEVTFACRVTTRSSSYSRRREVSASLRTVVDDLAREEDEEEDEEEPARAQEDLVNTSPSPNSNEQGPVPNTIEQEEDSNTDEAPPLPPPPMPVPVPLKQESSNRVWSDFFTRSFASFAPSIFESNPENAWENLLDPAILPDAILPELAATSEDEEESFSSMPCKRSLSQSSSAGRTLSISNPLTWSECITSLPPAPVSNKRRKVSEEPEDIDSFYDANAPSLGKVLEQSLGDFLTTV